MTWTLVRNPKPQGATLTAALEEGRITATQTTRTEDTAADSFAGGPVVDRGGCCYCRQLSNYSRLQKVGIWIWSDLCWFSFFSLCWDQRKVIVQLADFHCELHVPSIVAVPFTSNRPQKKFGNYLAPSVLGRSVVC